MSNTKDFHQVKGELKEAVHNVQEGFSDLRDGLSSAAGNAFDAGRAALDSARSMASDGVDSARCSATDLFEGTTRRIGQNPMTSVLVAAGIGFLSGFLVSRR
jgi:ElaB/YqjD/DUF883 family membrane-anchored ribosome-binding protein